MNDVRRRLAQGRPGEPAQKVENGVIESLDKLIKKAEDQATEASPSLRRSRQAPAQRSHAR